MYNGTQVLVPEIKNFERLEFERSTVNLLSYIEEKIQDCDFTSRDQELIMILTKMRCSLLYFLIILNKARESWN